MIRGLGDYQPHSAVVVTGTSPDSFSKAAQDGVQKAAAGLGRTAWEIIDSYEVTKEFGTVTEGIMTFEVTLTVWYRVRY